MIKNLGAKIMKNSKMKAVHDNDLKELLCSLGVYEDVVNGCYKCIFCGKKITIRNIDSIVPYENSVQFTCDEKDCHSYLIGWGDGNGR